ncbi:MAG TPA: LuxR C-terminal-related transcriptional regulator [Candidatus Saccharimonadales bacterium]|nr:LuxR C-terminal-related transcriptional regulator [Candidatus Saccharimonadales bacterium]
MATEYELAIVLQHIKMASGSVVAEAPELAAAHLGKAIDVLRQAQEAPPPAKTIEELGVIALQRAAELRLTRREFQILGFLATGMANIDIAQAEWVSEQTVKFHISNILRKLDAANRAEAAFIARREGLVVGTADADEVDSPKPEPSDPLTARQAEVLVFVSQGLTNQEIADRLGIGLQTVRYHVTNILSQLGVKNRTAAGKALSEGRVIVKNKGILTP